MAKETILIVDDQPGNIKVLMEILKDDYQTIAATNGVKALEIAEKHIPDLILLDIQMPEMDGFKVCGILKEKIITSQIPIIFVTALTEMQNEAKGLSLGAVDYLAKPVIPELVRARVKNHLELNAYRKRLEYMVEEQTQHLMELNEEIESTLLETLQTLGGYAEMRSKETGQHVRRVMEYSYLLAKLLDLPEEECYLIRQASAMHDIGKMAIPDAILQKPDKLNPEEFLQMQRHTEHGYTMLSSSQRELFRAAALVAYSHHEKWNGQGYPQGLSGEAIPLGGRITALADVFDALASERYYKKAWEIERIVTFLKEERGETFDPALVDLFLDNLDAFVTIKNQYQETQQEPIHES